MANQKEKALSLAKITVLTATKCDTVKTYYIDAASTLQCIQYGHEKYFNHRLESVQGIEHFSTLLSALSQHKNVILIRGTATPGLHKITERKEAKFPEAAEGCYWVMIDFDYLPVPKGMNACSREAVELYVKRLPQEFHDTSYFYQFSSS